MASGRRKKSKEEPAVKQEDKKEDKPVKRRRSADGDRQFRDDKRQKVSKGPELSAWVSTSVHARLNRLYCSPVQTSPENDRRIRQKIERPGVPAPTRTSAFIVPDRPSPPFREDDKVR